MALTTPLLYTVPAFDATNEQVFTFLSVGGSQVVANTLTIKNNATLATVYERTQVSYRFAHVLPANTLTNGTYYQATLATKDAEGNVSNTSAPIQFYCYTTPTFEITNMPNNNVVTNSSFAFNVRYNQIQGEMLNAYVFNLYSISGALISTSGLKYTTQSSLPITISYLFSGFEDSASYSVEVNGETVNGTQLTTGKIPFTTNYKKPDTFSSLTLTNNCKGGYITIKSNVVAIDGIVTPEPAVYIDDKEIDLRNEGSSVVWEDGYIIGQNWTMRIWGRDFTPDSEIFRFSNVNGDIVAVEYHTDDIYCWFELKARHVDWTWGYVAESAHIALPSSAEEIFCWVRSVNSLYDIKIENRGVVS